jgi:hypothetical protein
MGKYLKKKNKNKLFDKNKAKNKGKKNKNETKNLINSKHVNYSSINIKRPENKKIKNLKTEENKINNNKDEKSKKGGIIHNLKNRLSNAVQTIKKKFERPKKQIIEQKQVIKPIKNTKAKTTKTKAIKRSKSVQLNKANEIYKSFNDEEIKNILSKKRLNSYKKEIKTKKSTISKEKKLEKKAKKFITKNENNPQSKNIEKDLDVNLNINKVISEKNSYERNNYSKLKKDLWKKQNKKKGKFIHDNFCKSDKISRQKKHNSNNNSRTQY